MIYRAKDILNDIFDGAVLILCAVASLFLAGAVIVLIVAGFFWVFAP